MKDVDPQTIHFKVALALKKLFIENVKKQDGNKKKGERDIFLNVSMGNVAAAVGIRKATISDTINAKTVPNIITVGLIIMGLGKDIHDFADAYSKITDEEVAELKIAIKKKEKMESKE